MDHEKGVDSERLCMVWSNPLEPGSEDLQQQWRSLDASKATQITPCSLKGRGNQITCLIIYVDDMVITGNDELEIGELKRKLFLKFEMKDLGNLKYFLALKS